MADLPDRLKALLRYDDEIRAAAALLRPFGESWVTQLIQDFHALDENRQYLPNILDRLIEEAVRDKAERWAAAFRQTRDGELCTAESLTILREAEARGYILHVEKDGTIAATKGDGTSYLRSNNEILRFARFTGIITSADGRPLFSFRHPMHFPRGTTVYETTQGEKVAVFANLFLIKDDGTDDGVLYHSAYEYRLRTADQENWKIIQDF